MRERNGEREDREEYRNRIGYANLESYSNANDQIGYPSDEDRIEKPRGH